MNCRPMGSGLILPTRATGVLPDVLLLILCSRLQPVAGRRRGRASSWWVSVNTVHHLNSVWKQLSFISSQRKGILSRKTTKLLASPSMASIPLSCHVSLSPTPRRESNQL